MTTEQHTAQEQAQTGDAEQVIAQDRTPSPGIDPEKLLELAKARHRDGGVTLSWPTVIKIVEELRQGRAAAEERAALEFQKRNREGLVQRAIKMEEQFDSLAAHYHVLRRELSACQSILHQLARSGEVTPAYAEDAAMALSEEPTTSLARLKSEWQAEAARSGFLYGYTFCRMNGFLFDDQLQGAADEYVRRQAEEPTE